jgi:hypothetical protein
MCSKCGEIIHVPRSLIYPNEDDLAPYGRPWPRNWRDQFKQHRQGLADPKIQGLVAMGMGLLAILLLCLPDVGFYIGSVLCGCGLLLCIIGTSQVVLRRGRGLSYLLGGMGVCIGAFVLIVLPRILK